MLYKLSPSSLAMNIPTYEPRDRYALFNGVPALNLRGTCHVPGQLMPALY